MAILEEVAWHLQICNSCFYQVSKSWPMGLLYSARFIFPCPYAIYMYKIMILFKHILFRNRPISTKFHVDPTVETGFKVCSNGHAPLTVMPIYGKMMIKKSHSSSSKPRTAQLMILSLVAVTWLDKMLHNICISAEAISLLFSVRQ